MVIIGYSLISIWDKLSDKLTEQTSHVDLNYGHRLAAKWIRTNTHETVCIHHMCHPVAQVDHNDYWPQQLKQNYMRIYKKKKYICTI